MGTARYCWRGEVHTLVCKISGRFTFATHTHADSSVLLSLSLSLPLASSHSLLPPQTGKGRTACVLACFLAWVGEQDFETPMQALQHISELKRIAMENLTIPSQRRYGVALHCSLLLSVARCRLPSPLFCSLLPLPVCRSLPVLFAVCVFSLDSAFTLPLVNIAFRDSGCRCELASTDIFNTLPT